MQHFTFVLLCPRNPLVSMSKRNAHLGREIQNPENPSNLPQNRFKCLRRTFDHRGKNLRSTVP